MIKDSKVFRELCPFVEYANKSWDLILVNTKMFSLQNINLVIINLHNDSIKNPMNLKNMQRKLSLSVQLSKNQKIMKL